MPRAAEAVRPLRALTTAYHSSVPLVVHHVGPVLLMPRAAEAVWNLRLRAITTSAYHSSVPLVVHHAGSHLFHVHRLCQPSSYEGSC